MVASKSFFSLVVVVEQAVAAEVTAVTAQRQLQSGTAERRCRYLLTDQGFNVKNLTLLHGNAGTTCPLADGGDLHHEVCRQCAGWHKPCSGIYMACPSCCFQPGPAPLFSCERVPQWHQCEQIEAFLLQNNEVTVECAEGTEDEADQAPDATLSVEVDNPIVTGEISAECSWEAKTLATSPIPMLLKFTCSDCRVQGVPKLLKACCDMGMAFATSKPFKELLDQGVVPELWLEDCHNNTLLMDGYPPSVHVDMSPYTEFTKEKAQKRMLESVHTHYCANGVQEDSTACEEHPWHVVAKGLAEAGKLDASCEEASGGRRLLDEGCSRSAESGHSGAAGAAPNKNTQQETEDELSSAALRMTVLETITIAISGFAVAR